MVLVAQDRFPGALELGLDLGRVAVVEAVPLVTQPDADAYCETEPVGLVEAVFEAVGAPGSNGVGARGRQLAQRGVAAGAPDEVGLAVTQQLPAPIEPSQLDGDRFGEHGRGNQQGADKEQR